ncbi:DNA replication licensing factor MCM7 [Intoshia linei]|uniref:DNA replication licensing factor MCM7 n=1 Tax=Intoshia linei TaxID=1819745 RepID=A0A177B052_9BILA|nr:DNA replication licensing factor MCM7 [Intoshia linei]
MTISAYKDDKEKLKTFISSHSVIDEKGIKSFIYLDQIKRVAKRDSTCIFISLTELENYDTELAKVCMSNTSRYINILYQVVDEFLDSERMELAGSDTIGSTGHSVKDTLDVYIKHRLLMNQKIQNERNVANVNSNVKPFPPELIRRYDIFLKDDITEKTKSVRDVKSEHIGKMVKVSGIVTRTSDVKPRLVICTYTCDKCGSETYQQVNDTSFVPLQFCPSEQCTVNRTNGRLYMQTRASKFIKYQEIYIQEHSGEVPVGCIPRQITIHCRGDLTRLCQPGDHVIISGTFLPSLKNDAKSKKYGLINDTFIDAHAVIKVNNEEDVIQSEENLTPEEIELFSRSDFYDRLAKSVAPEIYGHNDIKKILLLLLVGSVDVSPEGMKIRGTINVCLMGDPGVAKSQMLLFVSRLATRSQYASGRGSSGVGLTASILKDPMTNEMILEGGSLVLADQGVCCIDEFDKMMDADRTAIHEAMEQQTISIAKAGINTTLNARVSILAAANPSQGRYNVKRSLEANVDLPAALLSRFDVLWLMRDIAKSETDLKMAQHIAHVHQNCMNPDFDFVPIPIPMMRKYISLCKKKRPLIPPSLSNFLTQAYVEMRKEARNDSASHGFTSPRSLLSLIRISIALAKLRLSNEVSQADICEAMRLIEKSKASRHIDSDNSRNKRNESHLVQIYAIIRDMPSENGKINIRTIKSTCTAKGFSPSQVTECLTQYEILNVWIVSQDFVELL